MTATAQHRSRLAIAIAVLVACGAPLLAAPPAHAAESTNYGIRPADSPDHFRLELARGAATKRTAVVSNNSERTVTFKIYAADALTTKQGGFALRSATDPRTGVGAWARLPARSITVKAGAQVKVPFRLTVPKHATPGDYAGGILIEPPPRLGKPGDLGNQTAVQLNIVERVGVRVYLRVAGAAAPALSAGPLTSHQTSRGLEFSVTLKNTGNIVLHPKGTLDVRGRPGDDTRLRFSKVESLLPGQSAKLRATWTNPSALKWGRAVATIEHEGGQERVSDNVRLVPLLPAALAGLLLLLAIWLGLRFARFLRRARRALAETAKRAEGVPLTGPVDPPAEKSQPGAARTRRRGRHLAETAGQR